MFTLKCSNDFVTLSDRLQVKALMIPMFSFMALFYKMDWNEGVIDSYQYLRLRFHNLPDHVLFRKYSTPIVLYKQK